MNFNIKTIILAAVLALATSEPCGPMDLLPLMSLLKDPNVAACQDETKFPIFPPTHLPTAEEKKLICGNSKCQDVLKKVISLGAPDCEVKVGEVESNIKKLAIELSTC